MTKTILETVALFLQYSDEKLEELSRKNKEIKRQDTARKE